MKNKNKNRRRVPGKNQNKTNPKKVKHQRVNIGSFFFLVFNLYRFKSENNLQEMKNKRKQISSNVKI